MPTVKGPKKNFALRAGLLDKGAKLRKKCAEYNFKCLVPSKQAIFVRGTLMLPFEPYQVSDSC